MIDFIIEISQLNEPPRIGSCVGLYSKLKAKRNLPAQPENTIYFVTISIALDIKLSSLLNDIHNYISSCVPWTEMCRQPLRSTSTASHTLPTKSIGLSSSHSITYTGIISETIRSQTYLPRKTSRQNKRQALLTTHPYSPTPPVTLDVLNRPTKYIHR